MLRWTLYSLLAATVLLGALGWPASPARAQGKADVTIAWAPWADAEAVTKTAALIIRNVLKKDVDIKLADISRQYPAIANGDLDIMLMAWLPATHADYVKTYGNDLVDYGALYTDAKVGLAVPGYVCQAGVRSIPDLARSAERFGNVIEGIGPDAGISGMTRRSLTPGGYDLEAAGFRIDYTSDDRMHRRVDQAIQANDWIVFTAWQPHWIFGKHPDLCFLDDPKRVYGAAESVHAVARKGFDQDQPELARFFKALSFPIGDLQAMLWEAEQSGDMLEAVKAYINGHVSDVRRWVVATRGG